MKTKQNYLMKAFRDLGIIIISTLMGIVIGVEYTLWKVVQIANHFGVSVDMQMVHDAIFKYFNHL